MAAIRRLHGIGRDSELWSIRALLGVLAIRTRTTLDWSRGWLSRRASGKLHNCSFANP